jgi:hypothetical protein
MRRASSPWAVILCEMCSRALGLELSSLSLSLLLAAHGSPGVKKFDAITSSQPNVLGALHDKGPRA